MSTDVTRLSAALADRYAIQRELGAGGMATVYLAHDIRHDRPVAVKVLRPELAVVIGAERFLAEIRTTANLQHPHILPLFDSGVSESFLYYVMPFVEGISLRDRMSREKQLPIPEAVRLTTEVASALDYAHRHGVIHRDIKPENILLHDGRALVADFGIALAASKAGTRMTETGMSLGTPSYMSPEQAMGERDLDARSDVYALGCVAYEMLTGEPPFSGPTAQAIVAKVMTADPASVASLRKTVPPHVASAVHVALEKLPADRFASAAEFAGALGNTDGSVRAARMAPTLRRRELGVVSVALVALAALVTGLALGRGTTRRVEGMQEVVAASLDMGDSGRIRPIAGSRLAMSPQGDRIAFVGSGARDAALWVREVGQPAARGYPDTEGAFAPFFSPDGQTIGFFTAVGGRTVMKAIPARGGVVRTILSDSVAWFGGASWGDDGNVYFTTVSKRLARIPATGGAVTVIASPDSTQGIKELDFPCVLPGSRHAVVMLWVGSLGSNKIGLVDLENGQVSILADGSYPRFMAPDRLVIGASNGRILVARMDPKTGRLDDSPVLVMQGVQDESANGTVQFAVADNGSIVYQKRSDVDAAMVWVDRRGAQVVIDSSLTGNLESPALSPDGSRLAMTVRTTDGSQVWVKQLLTGSFVRLSGDLYDADRPVWTPDGRHIAFLARDSIERTAWIRRADGSDSATMLLPHPMLLDEIAFDRSGRFVVFRTAGTVVGSRQLVVQERGVDSMPRPLISARRDTYAMTISPDGNWLAYVSEESGTKEVFVRPFPDVNSAKFAISAGGGVAPLWRRDGKELFFRTERGDLMSVPVTTGKAFTHGVPTLEFSRPGLADQDYYRNYDIAPDGKRFVMVDGGDQETRYLNLIVNWRTALDRGSSPPARGQ